VTLEETYEVVSPSIVALGSKLVKRDKPMFPEIIGTGFVVDSRGIIATNRHVALPLQQLPVHPKTGMPVSFAMFIGPLMQVEGKRTRGVFFRDIKDYVILDRFESAEVFYGEDVPDIAFLQLDVCDVPALILETDEESWRVGRAIATAGYAMGEDALIVYDKITQISPLLRHGIISSNYPYPGRSPHGFTTDIMTQGGESGSPFFQPDTGSVIGLLHSGFDGTNVTIGIPSWIVKSALDSCLEDYPFEFGGSPTLADIMKNPRPTMPLNWEKVILPAPPAPPKDED
jgi:S1-C subfamily serine protease